MITAREIKLNGWQSSIQKAIDIASKDTRRAVCHRLLRRAGRRANPQGALRSLRPDLLRGSHDGSTRQARPAPPPLTLWRSIPRPCGAHQSAHTACWMALYFMNGVAQHRYGGQK